MTLGCNRDGFIVIYAHNDKKSPRFQRQKTAHCLIRMPSKRLLAIDTETTGLILGQDRVINFGAVMIEDGRLTHEFERFYNTGGVRMHPAVIKIHGLTESFLADQPSIGEGIADIIGLISGADIVGHNVKFDLNMLDAECVRLGLPKLSGLVGAVYDTVAMSRSRFPGGKHNLDALCSKLKIPLTERVRHGALIDARLCAKCYISLNIEQTTMFNEPITPVTRVDAEVAAAHAAAKLALRVLLATEDEVSEHEDYLLNLQRETKASVVWLAGPSTPAAAASIIVANELDGGDDVVAGADVVALIAAVQAGSISTPEATAVEIPPATELPFEAYGDEAGQYHDEYPEDSEAVPAL